MEIGIGKIVWYILTEEDASQINRRRTTGKSIAERIAHQIGTDRVQWPLGAQAHIGNGAYVGDVLPLLVVKDWGDGDISGQVFLDGNDTLWVEHVPESNIGGCGKWCWPQE